MRVGDCDTSRLIYKSGDRHRDRVTNRQRQRDRHKHIAIKNVFKPALTSIAMLTYGSDDEFFLAHDTSISIN